MAKCNKGTGSGCMYKINLKVPGVEQELKAGISQRSTIGKNETDTYLYSCKGTEEKVEIIFKIISVNNDNLDNLDNK